MAIYGCGVHFFRTKLVLNLKITFVVYLRKYTKFNIILINHSLYSLLFCCYLIFSPVGLHQKLKLYNVCFAFGSPCSTYFTAKLNYGPTIIIGNVEESHVLFIFEDPGHPYFCNTTKEEAKMLSSTFDVKTCDCMCFLKLKAGFFNVFLGA